MADPYRSLESPDPSTVDWLAEQAELSRSALDGMPGSDAARHWLDRLFFTDTRGVPTARGSGLFYLRMLRGESAPSLVHAGPDGCERVLVHPDTEAEAGFAALTAWQASADGRWLAFQVCERGAESAEVVVRDAAGEHPDRVLAPALTRPALAWLSRGTTVLGAYTAGPGDGGTAALRFHPLDGAAARTVWSPAAGSGPTFLTPLPSPDGRWLLVSVRYGADIRNAVWLAEVADDPGEPLTGARLLGRGEGATHARFGPDGQVYLAGSGGEAALYRLSPQATGERRPLIPATPGTSVHGLAVTPGWAAILRTGPDGTEPVVVPTGGGTPLRLPVPGPRGSVSWLTGDPGRPRIWFEYTDAVRPRRPYRWEPGYPVAVPEFGADRPGGLPKIVTRQETCRSADGTPVAVTVAARADLIGTPVPYVLAVYGGFGQPAALTYRPDMILWMLSGGGYAVAHVRGGSERGAGWHAAGRGAGKLRTVEDTVAVAEHLVRTGHAASGRLAVTGNSNGALIAAAAAISRPELFAACVAISPVTDLVRYPRLGAGRAWLTEYGDPADPADLPALLALSPYHNVRGGVAYPAFLIAAGSDDARVPPAHARKLCAALQAATASPPGRRPVLLREQAGVGHAGGSSGQRIAFGVDQVVFLWHVLDLAPPPPPS